MSLLSLTCWSFTFNNPICRLYWFCTINTISFQNSTIYHNISLNAQQAYIVDPVTNNTHTHVSTPTTFSIALLRSDVSLANHKMLKKKFGLVDSTSFAGAHPSAFLLTCGWVHMSHKCQQQPQQQNKGVDLRVRWDCLRKCKRLKQCMMLSSLLS